MTKKTTRLPLVSAPEPKALKKPAKAPAKVPARVPAKAPVAPELPPEAKKKASRSSSLPATLVAAVPSAARAAKALIAFEEALVGIEAEMRAAEKAGSIQTARAFAVLHFLQGRFDDRAKLLSGLFQHYKNVVLPDMFDQEGITNVPLTEGFRVGVSYSLYASIVAGKKDEAYNWLRDNDLGDLIVEAVNSSSLSGVARAWREENRDLPDSLFNTKEVGNTSVTKTK